MAKIPDAYLHRIQRDLPGTDPNHLDYITDGMVNDVVVVDRTWVHRFAKHDWSQSLMQHEAKVLNLVRAHVDTPVPNLELLSDDCCRYPYLAGTPLTRRTLLGWTEADRNAVLKSVVRFLAQMHADGAASFTRSAGVGSCPTRPSSRIIVQSTRNRPSANSRGAIPWAALQRRCYRVDGPRADRRHHETSAPRR